MKNLADSKTIENLRAAFAGESQANRRYTYFSRKADEEGFPEIAALFRAVSEGETAHALRHFDYMRTVGDPVTKVPIADVKGMLNSAVNGETFECTNMYPEYAKVARQEGFEEIAKWFEALAKAEKAHAGKFKEALDKLESAANA
ncbi:MAG TPA: rubrerythrin family protein [Candidatus Bathyarchaeia archaeon]|nr:rubrerythrin family protein [Candidatus Bathyarchaeia archaeon]